MEIDQYAKSELFVKLLDMGSLWEVYMESSINDKNQYVTLDGRVIDKNKYIVHFLKNTK